jgi:hypothetical protein
MSELENESLRKNRQVPKGIKGMKGRPMMYDEMKQRKWYTLTPTVIEIVRQRAEKQGLTESEALERLLRFINGLPLPKNENKNF